MDTYFQPDTLNDALDWLEAGGGIVAAGCTDLLAATAYQNLRGPVLDITGIAGMCGISQMAEGWRIGAATPWAAVRDADFPAAFEGLKQAAAEVGSVQIQNAGTIGGNLCNASPAADGMPALLTLDVRVELASKHGRRMLPLADFVVGPRQTGLRQAELLVALHIPAGSRKGQGAFVKLGARKYMVISISMAAARVSVLNGVIDDIALAIGACGPVARRLTGLEKTLLGQQADEAVSLVEPRLIAPDISPIDDIRADKSYREDAAIEVIRRALNMALEAAE